MKTNPFKSPGQWYRGNTHSHSTESDGRLPMDERFAAYREHSYDFLVLTDHRTVNDVSSFSTDGFLAISGSEVHPSNPAPRHHSPLLFLDLTSGLIPQFTISVV